MAAMSVQMRDPRSCVRHETGLQEHITCVFRQKFVLGAEASETKSEQPGKFSISTRPSDKCPKRTANNPLAVL